MDLLKKILIFIIIFVFPLGEFARIDLGNGIAMTFLDLGVFCTVAVWLLGLILKRRHIKFTFKTPILLFFSACIISLIFNIFSYTLFHLFVSSLYLIRYFMYFCLFFIIKDFNEKDKKQIEISILIGGGLILFFGFLQFFLYPSLKNLSYLGWDDHFHRMFSTFLDPNFSGVFFVLYFLFVSFKVTDSLKAKNKKTVILYAILSLFSLVGVLLSFSRSAYIMLGIGLVLLFLFNRFKNDLLKIATYVGIAGLMLVILLYTPGEGTNLFRTASSTARIGDIRNAINVFQTSPVFGVGFNSYRYAQKKIGVFSVGDSIWDVGHGNAGADTSFLFILATTGIVGFCAFIYLWYSILSKTIHKARLGNLHAKIFLSSIIALFFGSLFVNSFFYPLILFWVWIVMGFMDYT